MDDDVNTDTEVMNGAKRTCKRDCVDVLSICEEKKAKDLANNSSIAQRVKYSDQFNRIGKFKGAQVDTMIHPSLDKVAVPWEA